MLVVPELTTAFLDPFTTAVTLVLICNIRDPLTDSLTAAIVAMSPKAETYLKRSGSARPPISDRRRSSSSSTACVTGKVNYAMHEIDPTEAPGTPAHRRLPIWPTSRQKEGYSSVAPVDSMQDLRSEMVLTMESLGIQIEAHHHEVATAGQAEIDMRFTSLTRMADHLMTYKYVVKNVARKRGMTATFMPKPLFEDNASGMHVHQSIWKGKTNLFHGTKYADLSELGLHYIGGLLKHAWALCALCAPTTNSYRRLVPGYEAPINLVYSQRNRSACCRIPMYTANPRAKRVEFRSPDPSCNGYLARRDADGHLDGVQNRIDPGEPIDKNLL